MDVTKIAMLSAVTIVNGGLLGERKDRAASHLVQTTYNVSDKRAKASKYLIDRNHKSVRAVLAASQRVREVLYKYTAPFGDQKTRILPVKNFDRFKYEVETEMAKLREARDEYLRYYPALVAESERDLGPLFDPQEYPPVNKIAAMFIDRVTYWPIPDAGHFVAELMEEAQEEAKASIKTEVEERLLEATASLVERAKKAVSAYAEKLQKTKADDKGYPDGLIHDSLTINLKDTANLIDSLNLTENLQIKKVSKDLRRLANAIPVKEFRSEAYGKTSTKYVYDREAGYGTNFEVPPKREVGLNMANEILAKLEALDLKDAEVSEMVNAASDYME